MFVADDNAGQTYLKALEEADVAYSVAIDNTENLPTGKCVLVTPDGKRTMSTYWVLVNFLMLKNLIFGY